MAQKRNPTSLRLQTRLQGHEKRFASCWFTDYFLPQSITNDLVKRLYLGHLLEKGGGWYGEKSESEIPETCMSVYFSYRRSFMISVVLDRRKQDYTFSTSFKGAMSKRKSKASSGFRLQESGSGTSLSRILGNKKQAQLASFPALSASADRFKVANKETFFDYTHLADPIEKSGFNLALLSPESQRKGNVGIKAKYLLIATLFGCATTQNYCGISSLSEISSNPLDTQMKDDYQTQLDFLKDSSCFLKKVPLHSFAMERERERRDWLHRALSCQYTVTPDLSSVSTIQAICDIAQQGKKNKRQTGACVISSNESAFKGESSPFLVDRQKEILQKDFNDVSSMTSRETRVISPLLPASYWSSLTFIRAPSVSQNVEFCLYTVAFLYKKRVSFSLIKDSFFRMLAASGIVRGARLVCSGRQGGRSKSAMRARKQSALWGQSALSLYSSKLAFASTSQNTPFGQIGIKVWVCYK